MFFSMSIWKLELFINLQLNILQWETHDILFQHNALLKINPAVPSLLTRVILYKELVGPLCLFLDVKYSALSNKDTFLLLGFSDSFIQITGLRLEKKKAKIGEKHKKWNLCECTTLTSIRTIVHGTIVVILQK